MRPTQPGWESELRERPSWSGAGTGRCSHISSSFPIVHEKMKRKRVPKNVSEIAFLLAICDGCRNGFDTKISTQSLPIFKFTRVPKLSIKVFLCFLGTAFLRAVILRSVVSSATLLSVRFMRTVVLSTFALSTVVLSSVVLSNVLRTTMTTLGLLFIQSLDATHCVVVGSIFVEIVFVGPVQSALKLQSILRIIIC